MELPLKPERMRPTAKITSQMPSTSEDSLSSSVYHGGAHVDHVLSVAQGNVLLSAQGKKLGGLINRNGLAGEGGLLDLHAGAFNDPAVGRNRISGLQDYDIAGDQILAL